MYQHHQISLQSIVSFGVIEKHTLRQAIMKKMMTPIQRDNARVPAKPVLKEIGNYSSMNSKNRGPIVKRLQLVLLVRHS